MTDTPNQRDGLTDERIKEIAWESVRWARPTTALRSFARAIEAEVRAADREARPAPASVEALKEKLTDVIAAGLDGTYHCGRVWSAWRAGTMSEDDFSPVDESDTPAELADAVIAALAAASTPPAEAQMPQAKFHDPRVRLVYAVLCSGETPPPSHHWEGFAARRIVDALDRFASEARATGDAAPLQGFSCARRAANPGNPDATCATYCGNREACASTEPRLFQRLRELGRDPKTRAAVAKAKAEAAESIAREARAATGAAGEPQPREGWKWVPVEPTPAMLEAGDQKTWVFPSRECWAVMLAAAPQADSGAAGGQGDSNA